MGIFLPILATGTGVVFGFYRWYKWLDYIEKEKKKKEELRTWILGPGKQFYAWSSEEKALDSRDPKDLPEKARLRFNKWKKEQDAIKAAYEERERNPDLNTDDVKQHVRRLYKYKHSKFRGEYEYMGPRGGIYTYTAKGNRNYR